MKLVNSHLVLFSVLLVIGCGMKVAQVSKGTKGTKVEYSPLMYKEQPVSILVAPIDYGSAYKNRPADFDNAYGEAISDTLRKHGYQVISSKDDHNADAVLYTEIQRWDRYFGVLSYEINGAMLLALKSTKTGQVIWKQGIFAYKGHIGGGSNLLIVPVQLSMMAIQTASGLSLYHPNVTELRETVQLALESLPYGKFHESYGKDMNDQLLYENRDDEKAAKFQESIESVTNFFKSSLNKIRGQDPATSAVVK